MNVSYNESSKHDITSLSTSQANTKRYENNNAKQSLSGVKSIIPKQIKSNDPNKITKPVNFITNPNKFNFNRSMTPNIIRKDGNNNTSFIKVPSTYAQTNKKNNFGFSKSVRPLSVNISPKPEIDKSYKLINPNSKYILKNSESKVNISENSIMNKSRSIPNKNRTNVTNNTSNSNLNKSKLFNARTTAYLLSNTTNQIRKSINTTNVSNISKRNLNSSNSGRNLNNGNFNYKVKIITTKSTSKSIPRHNNNQPNNSTSIYSKIKNTQDSKSSTQKNFNIQNLNNSSKPISVSNNNYSNSYKFNIKPKTTNTSNKPINVQMEFFEDSSIDQNKRLVENNNLISRQIGKSSEDILRENDTSPFAHRTNKKVNPNYKVLNFSNNTKPLANSFIDKEVISHKLNIAENHDIIKRKTELITGIDENDKLEKKEGPIYNKIKLGATNVATNNNSKFNTNSLNIRKLEDKSPSSFVDDLFNSPTVKSLISGPSFTPKENKGKVIKSITEFTKTGFQGSVEKKNNQDIAIIYPNFTRNKEYYFLSVCDGHGYYGHDVSRFIKATLPINLENNFFEGQVDVFDSNKEKVYKLIEDAFIYSNNTLNSCGIDTKFSGSTCVSMFMNKNRIITANIGDSRIVLGKCKNGSKSYLIILNSMAIRRLIERS